MSSKASSSAAQLHPQNNLSWSSHCKVVDRPHTVSRSGSRGDRGKRHLFSYSAGGVTSEPASRAGSISRQLRSSSSSSTSEAGSLMSANTSVPRYAHNFILQPKAAASNGNSLSFDISCLGSQVSPGSPFQPSATTLNRSHRKFAWFSQQNSSSGSPFSPTPVGSSNSGRRARSGGRRRLSRSSSSASNSAAGIGSERLNSIPTTTSRAHSNSNGTFSVSEQSKPTHVKISSRRHIEPRPSQCVDESRGTAMILNDNRLVKTDQKVHRQPPGNGNVIAHTHLTSSIRSVPEVGSRRHYGAGIMQPANPNVNAQALAVANVVSDPRNLFNHPRNHIDASGKPKSCKRTFDTPARDPVAMHGNIPANAFVTPRRAVTPPSRSASTFRTTDHLVWE